MSGSTKIGYLQGKEIDRKAWDTCLDGADNTLIYGYSFYLDAMCDNWDAVVLGNYEMVMPLPWQKKWGIKYIYHPPLTAQLGVFGNGITADILSAFLQAIPAPFRYWDFPLNYNNNFPVSNYPLYQRNNYVLNLNKPYILLQSGYRAQTKRNIKKAIISGCFVKKGIEVADVISLSKKSPAGSLTEREYNCFSTLYSHLHAQQKGLTYGVYTRAGVLSASCVFVFSQNRGYYILVGNDKNSKKSGASHLLIDAFINDHAEQNLILDFEGGDLPGLSFFYSSFGAGDEKYAAIHYNRLPLFIKWLKK